MKKLLGLTCLLVACASLAPSKVVVIRAQTLPVSKTFAWDAPPDPCASGSAPATCPATSYTAALDGTVIGSPTTTSVPVTFTTGGVHTLTVFATNVWGNSPTATLTINIVVTNKPGNLRVQ